MEGGLFSFQQPCVGFDHTAGIWITAPRSEASSEAALLHSATVCLAAAARAPIWCAENFRASEFSCHRRGSYRLGKRRKRSYSWQRPSRLPERKYSGEARTVKKNAPWAPASAP